MLKTHNLYIKVIFFDHLLPFFGKKEEFMIAYGGRLEKWRPYWNFAWSALFADKGAPIEYL